MAIAKSSPKKKQSTNRCGVKSAVLTDKDDIAAIEGNRKTKSMKRRISKEGEKKPKEAKEANKNKKTNGGDKGADNYCFCLVCLEAFADSRSIEKWIQWLGTCRLYWGQVALRFS